MKKLLSTFLCVVLLLGLSIPVFAAPQSGTVNYCMVEIIVDGAKIVPKDANGKLVEPFIYNGSTYLPVRSVANALGLDVDWESGMVKLTSGAERTAAIGDPSMSEREVSIPMGGQDTKVSLDGEVLELKDAAGNSVTPIISNGTTYLPVRAIADSLNVPVYWDGENRIVYLGKRIEWLTSKETYTSKEYGTSTYTYTYDDQGNILTETTVSPRYTAKDTYTYDARGNMLTHTYKDNGKDYSEDYSYTYTYDANDNMLTERYVDKLDPEYNYTSVYTYDAQGNTLTDKTEYDEGNSYTYTYTYDADGNCLKETSLGPSYNSETTYTYDANGNTLTCKTVYSDGDYSSYTYTYDENGKLTSYAYEYRYGDEIYWSKNTYVSTYDEEGNLLSSVTETTDQDGTERRETLYSYNGNTTTIRTITDGVTEIDTYTYDDNDNLLEWVNVSGTDRTRTVYTYDDGNKILSRESTESDGTVNRTTYRYDAWGNTLEITGPYDTSRYEYIAREW